MTRILTTTAVLSLLLNGCGPAPILTVAISGTVTLDDKPVKEGVVVFYPDNAGDAAVSAIITDGRFSAPVIPQGQYKAAVRSLAVDTSNKLVDSSFGSPDPKNAKPDLIPAKYREPSIPVDASIANDAIKIELKSK